MHSLNKFSDGNGNAHPAPMALFRPEHQSAVLEIISSTGRGEMSTAARIWSRLFPSKADRAITANETALIEAKGKTQRQMVILVGEALHKDAKARLATQHHI